MAALNVGIVGATGAVGKEIIGCLEKRCSFPIANLRLFGSKRSAGRKIETSKFGSVTVELFSEEAARECDVVFLAVDGNFSSAHAENICRGDDGPIVIDNSSAFRYKEGIPLVVPEINAETTKGKKLIANPNCTTAIGLMAIWPLHKLFGLSKMVMSTYQAASGAGQPGMDELMEGTRAVLNGERDVAEHKVFAHPLPFNVIPHIDKFQDNARVNKQGWRRQFPPKVYLVKKLSTVTVLSANWNAKASAGLKRMISIHRTTPRTARQPWSLLPPLK